jgi:hypothetical protein
VARWRLERAACSLEARASSIRRQIPQTLAPESRRQLTALAEPFGHWTAAGLAVATICRSHWQRRPMVDRARVTAQQRRWAGLPSQALCRALIGRVVMSSSSSIRALPGNSSPTFCLLAFADQRPVFSRACRPCLRPCDSGPRAWAMGSGGPEVVVCRRALCCLLTSIYRPLTAPENAARMRERVSTCF